MICAIDGKNAPNLRKLVLAAGVSIASVSRALGGKSKAKRTPNFRYPGNLRHFDFFPILFRAQDLKGHEYQFHLA